MKLRTQILLVLGTLFVGALFVLEFLSSSTIAPAFERNGLEMVSVLSQRSRDDLQSMIGKAEFTLLSTARFLDRATGNLSEQGTYVLKISGFDELAFFEWRNARWEFLGSSSGDKKNPWRVPFPGAISPRTSLDRRIQHDARGWYLWIRQRQRALVIRVAPGDFKPFGSLIGSSQSFLLSDNDGQIDRLSSSLDPADPDAATANIFWERWVRSVGMLEKVESVRREDREFYASLAPSENYHFAVLTLWAKDEVQSEWFGLRRRLFYLAGFLIGLGLLIILALVRSLTAPLERLETAAQRVGEGDFSLRFPERRNNEIGRLMMAFELMSGKIQGLLERTQQSVRMEMELQTAKLVQERFSPAAAIQLGSVEVHGRTLTASECGGDLWAAWQTREYAYVIVADATGHGVPAALMTSSLRAVIAILESAQLDQIPQMVGLLRRAIEACGHQQTNMTALLLQIDKVSGFVTTFNASHESAYVMPPELTDALTWKDIAILPDQKNLILGFPSPAAPKTDGKQLIAGQRIVLYTDGLGDLRSPEGKPWSERSYLKELSASFVESASGPVANFAKKFFERIEERRAGRELIDDLTIVVIEWWPASRKNREF